VLSGAGRSGVVGSPHDTPHVHGRHGLEVGQTLIPARGGIGRAVTQHLAAVLAEKRVRASSHRLAVGMVQAAEDRRAAHRPGLRRILPRRVGYSRS
jgi:hypothetical protein